MRVDGLDVEEATKFLFLEDHDQFGDVAIVFGLDTWKDPIDKALELYFSHKVKKLVVSGGINRSSGEPEAENMYQYALAKGVKQDDLILENKAGSTLENVLFSKKLLEKNIGFENLKTVCGVMVNVHARRAMMTMKKHLPAHVKIKACPYVYRKYNLSGKDWFTHPGAIKIVKSELDKIKKYLAKGDIAVLQLG